MSDEKELVAPTISLLEIGNLLFRMATGYDDRDGLLITERIHKLIHYEKMYVNTVYTGSVVNNGGLEVLFCPNNLLKSVHIGFVGYIGGDGLFELYENPTCTNSGTINISYNQNRLSSNINLSKIYISPAVSNLNTNILRIFIPGGKNNGTGANIDVGDEFILKPSNTYLFRILNISGGTQPISIKLMFHEN